MADLKYYDVILKPVVTEKSMNSMAEKKYVFYVNPDATKTQIAEAVDGRLIPTWLEVNKEAMSVKVAKAPVRDELDYEIEEHLIIELYSK